MKWQKEPARVAPQMAQNMPLARLIFCASSSPYQSPAFGNRPSLLDGPSHCNPTITLRLWLR